MDSLKSYRDHQRATSRNVGCRFYSAIIPHNRLPACAGKIVSRHNISHTAAFSPAQLRLNSLSVLTAIVYITKLLILPTFFITLYNLESNVTPSYLLHIPASYNALMSSSEEASIIACTNEANAIV